MVSPLKSLFSALGGESTGHLHREELIQGTQAAQAAQAAAKTPAAPPAQAAPAPQTPIGSSTPGQQSFLANAAVASPPQQNTATKTLLGS